MATVLAAFTGAVAAPPAQGADATPDPFFGTWSDGMSLIAHYGNASGAARLDDVSSAGVGLVRQYIWWDRIETSPGTFDWAVMDELVKQTTARGVSILPTLLYTPEFYSSKPPGSTSSYKFPPSDPATLGRFAAAMVKRYGTHGTYWKCTNYPVLGWSCPEPYRPITMWEVWNEPDYTSWWKGAPSPAEYLELLKATHSAIKAADPQAKVVLGSMTNGGGSSSDGYLAQLYELGARDHFDVLSLNPYARDVGAMMAFIKGQRSVAAAHGDASKPILITEWGWATGGPATHYIVTSEACQAALVYHGARQLSARRDELNLLAATQFQWQDVLPIGASTSWPQYAGVRGYAENSDVGPAKPSLDALKAAIAGRPAPGGVTLSNCPADLRTLDGGLQPMTVSTTGGTGTGSVTSSPKGIDCGTDCRHEWQPGLPVTLTATPAAGSKFVGWKGAACNAATCAVTADRAHQVQAVFSSAPGVGTYQETSGHVRRAGTWVKMTSTADKGGASMVAVNGPASAQFTFVGTGVRWFARTGPSGGKNVVYLDGVRVATIDRYSASVRYAVQVYNTSTLALGQHTIRITHTGTKNAAANDDDLGLDAFAVR